MPRKSKNRIASSSADHANLAEAIDALRAGELVVYPTETFYALGADTTSPAALKRLFQLKHREAGKAVASIASDLAMASTLFEEMPAQALRLAQAFWPGPLTLVLKARAGLNPGLLGPGGDVGVRVSSHSVARALASGLGHPITATSANLSGEPPARTLAEARDSFGDKVAVYLEGGVLKGGPPSTVIAFSNKGITIVRVGAIDERQLGALLSIQGLE